MNRFAEIYKERARQGGEGVVHHPRRKVVARRKPVAKHVTKHKVHRKNGKGMSVGGADYASGYHHGMGDGIAIAAGDHNLADVIHHLVDEKLAAGEGVRRKKHCAVGAEKMQKSGVRRCTKFVDKKTHNPWVHFLKQEEAATGRPYQELMRDPKVKAAYHHRL